MTATADIARQKLAGHTIWLWHYLHADWQWEQSREWHEERYALAVNEVLDLMREDDELTYFFDSTSEFLEPVVRMLGPRMEELRQRVREGRIRIVSGQVANARPNQVGEETYLRNLQMGRQEMAELFEGAPLTLFHSVDIAIGHSQMPQILQLAGFDRYRAWRPHAPMNALGIPHQFVWEGMDGSKVLVTRGPYGGFYLKEHVPEGFQENWDEAFETLYDALLADQLEEERSVSKQLWIIQGCDDARPYRAWHGDMPVDMPGFVAEWRKREDVPLNWCTPVEFTEAVAEYRDALPIVSGVLEGADCSYNASNSGANGLWAWRLLNDRRLLLAERWAALAALTGKLAPEEDLKGLWRQHLVYQAHAEDYAFAKDFDHLVDLARDVKFRAAKIEKESLQAIARAAGGGDRQSRQVFNPHPWPVEVDLDLYHACAVAGVEALEVVDDAGNVLPQQQISQFRHPRYAGSVNDQDHLVRLELPALGYRTIRINELSEAASSTPEPPADGVVETDALRLVFRDHALREVTDRASGATYRSPDGEAIPAPTVHLLDNQNWLSMGPELGRETFQAESSEWRETGPLRWKHRGEGRLGPYAAVVETSVADRGREVQVKVRLEGHWAVPPVTGFVSLLTPVGTGGAMTVDVPFGVEARDPDNDVYSGDEPDERMFERLRPGFFWARSWADWSAPDHGVTTIGADGNFFWQKEADRYGPVLIRVIKFVPGSWEEQCAPVMTGSGVHEFTYALRFHDGEWRAADPQRRAAELHLPVRAVRADFATGGALPATHSFVEIAGPALASAVYSAGGQQIVRIYEHEGTGGSVTITLDRAPSVVTAIDLLGQPVEVPLSVSGNVVTVEVRPWQIVTLRV